jgi:nucleoside-diphosphate-sugar epimerase
MNILIIGGTRQIGYLLLHRLLEHGHRITILNRGMTPAELPDSVSRLMCDRTQPQQLRRALGNREFDAVVDTAMYKGPEAETIVDLLSGHIGHYVFISTGQVYLVREGISRPFRESDYAGPLTGRPELMSYNYEEWMYGYDKRQAEDIFAHAWQEQSFPYTSLRLPMVNGRRDKFARLYGYILRMKDRGPILVPDTPNLPLRHIYIEDVVTAIETVITSGQGKGKAYNISQEETVSLDDFLGIVGEYLGIAPNIVRVERDLLEANGFLPDCSPFSDTWMSELDNALSKDELGMTYTPLRTYLKELVAHYEQFPLPAPVSYRRRNAERSLLIPKT